MWRVTCIFYSVGMEKHSEETLEERQIAAILASVPSTMLVADEPGLVMIWEALSPRLEAGWTTAEIRRYLQQRMLPNEVKHMARLVAYRLSKMWPEPLRSQPDALVVHDTNESDESVEMDRDYLEREEQIRRENPHWTKKQIALAIIKENIARGREQKEKDERDVVRHGQQRGEY